MNRGELRRVAAQTIAVVEAGQYVSQESGRTFAIGQAVAQSIRSTTVFSTEEIKAVENDVRRDTVYTVKALSTLDGAAWLRRQTGRVPTILNFASARRPGGGFENGAMAQEEDIAYRSSLYASLRSRSEYYRESLDDLREGLYFDKAVFTPGMVVIRDADYRLVDPWDCHCVSAPAPNRGAALRNGTSEATVRAAMLRRIQLVLAVMAQTGASDIVLGAYGCGVFKNDPNCVAEQFHAVLVGQCQGIRFQHVLFAVPNQCSPNHQAFAQRFARQGTSTELSPASCRVV
ncbi:MAG: TIGR02452 family protein [Coriobacteriales bacterium]|nr:TIGR02452 family protein [Coriobacteriales bacterium]